MNGRPGYASFDFPPGSKNFTLRVTTARCGCLARTFAKPAPGVVYSSLGVNGANITLLSRAMNGAALGGGVAPLSAGSGGGRLSGPMKAAIPTFVDGTWANELKAAVRRLQAALPGVSILLMSPMDRGERRTRRRDRHGAGPAAVVIIETKVAAETGVAFFNTFQAMGGRGNHGRWYSGRAAAGGRGLHPSHAGRSQDRGGAIVQRPTGWI